MNPRRTPRYCRCGTRLARDNPAAECAQCTAATRDRSSKPPAVPAAFWDTDEFRDAFRAQHIGRVSRAYRKHQHHLATHGKDGISQETLAGWMGITQAQVSRIENGAPIKHLDTLGHWARVLNIPQHLLWFTLPGEPPSPPPDTEPTTTHPWPTAGGFAEAESSRWESVTAHPGRLDAATVDLLATILATQRRVEDHIGAAAIRAPMAHQLTSLTQLLRETTGRHRDDLATVVAEWSCYVGWLHAAVGDHRRATVLFTRAAEIADDAHCATVAATAISFHGYLARKQGRPHGVVRAASAALATPGTHPTQRIFDLIQAAQGHAALGDPAAALHHLDQATNRIPTAGPPPPSVYWYTEPFFWLNAGLVYLALGRRADAAATIRDGLTRLPRDHRDAEWAAEYRAALATAEAGDGNARQVTSGPTTRPPAPPQPQAR